MRSKVNLESDFQNVLFGLKFDRNGPNNIINILNLLSSPFEVKGEREVRFSKYSDWAQI